MLLQIGYPRRPCGIAKSRYKKISGKRSSVLSGRLVRLYIFHKTGKDRRGVGLRFMVYSLRLLPPLNQPNQLYQHDQPSIYLQLILRRQRRKRMMRFSLIPENNRGNVVLQWEVSSVMPPAKRLDR